MKRTRQVRRGYLLATPVSRVDAAPSVGSARELPYLPTDRAGVAAALTQGLTVIGTLGVLDRAARRGLVNLETAFTRLQATNFHYPPALLDTMLAEWRRDRGT